MGGRYLTGPELAIILAPYDQAMQRCRQSLQPMEEYRQANPGTLDNALIYSRLKAEYEFHRTARIDFICELYKMGCIRERANPTPEQVQRGQLCHDIIADRASALQSFESTFQ